MTPVMLFSLPFYLPSPAKIALQKFLVVKSKKFVEIQYERIEWTSPARQKNIFHFRCVQNQKKSAIKDERLFR